jgi:hypothetical protein
MDNFSKLKEYEPLFENGNFETPKKINRSEKVVSLEQIDAIDNGITLEQLDAFKLPIFKYKTQITIHGIFPEMGYILVGGYKHIFQNQNKSVGVRYNAIDYDKKKRLFQILRTVNGFSISENSQHFYVSKHKFFQTKEEAVAYHNENFKPIIDRINKDLFIGHTSSGIGFLPMFGYCAIIRLFVEAFYEKDFDAIVENITGKSMVEVNEIVEAKRIEIEIATKERKERYERERIEREAIEAEFKETAIKEISESELVKITEVTKSGKYLLVGSDDFRVLTVEKKRKFGVRTDYFKTLSEAISDMKKPISSYISYNTKRDHIKGNFLYALPEMVDNVTPPKPETPKEKVSLNNVKGVEIVDYSEKAIAIIGNTIPIKDALKDVGCKFNRFLTVNGERVAGWIASKKIQPKIELIVNSL